MVVNRRPKHIAFYITLWKFWWEIDIRICFQEETRTMWTVQLLRKFVCVDDSGYQMVTIFMLLWMHFKIWRCNKYQTCSFRFLSSWWKMLGVSLIMSLEKQFFMFWGSKTTKGAKMVSFHCCRFLSLKKYRLFSCSSCHAQRWLLLFITTFC